MSACLNLSFFYSFAIASRFPPSPLPSSSFFSNTSVPSSILSSNVFTLFGSKFTSLIVFEVSNGARYAYSGLAGTKDEPVSINIIDMSNDSRSKSSSSSIKNRTPDSWVVEVSIHFANANLLSWREFFLYSFSS